MKSGEVSLYSTGADGSFSVLMSDDKDFQSVDVEFVPKEQTSPPYTFPRVVFEWNGVKKCLHALVWADPKSEEPTDEIVFTPPKD